MAEFGEVGIDDTLLAKNTKMQAEEEIIEMMNGCICCTVRQDLIVVLEKLSKRIKAGKLHLDGIVIETTGMADPGRSRFMHSRNVHLEFPGGLSHFSNMGLKSLRLADEIDDVIHC